MVTLDPQQGCDKHWNQFQPVSTCCLKARGDDKRKNVGREVALFWGTKHRELFFSSYLFIPSIYPAKGYSLWGGERDRIGQKNEHGLLVQGSDFSSLICFRQCHPLLWASVFPFVKMKQLDNGDHPWLNVLFVLSGVVNYVNRAWSLDALSLLHLTEPGAQGLQSTTAGQQSFFGGVPVWVPDT